MAAKTAPALVTILPLKAVVAEHIRAALVACDGDIMKTAQALQISVRTLQRHYLEYRPELRREVKPKPRWRYKHFFTEPEVAAWLRRWPGATMQLISNHLDIGPRSVWGWLRRYGYRYDKDARSWRHTVQRRRKARPSRAAVPKKNQR